MTRFIVLAAVALLAAPAAFAAEGWRYGMGAEFTHDDNATRGLYDADRKSDSILAVEGSATRSWPLSPRSGLLLRGSARYSHFVDLSDVSNLALTGRAAWRFQPSPGFGAPWFEIAGQAQLLRHADSELRDGSILGVEASTGSYVTDRTRLSAGIGFDKRSGGGTAGLYDLSNQRIWGTIDVRVGVRSILYARLAHQDGDHVFNSVTVSGLSPVWEADPVYIDVFGRASDSYRLEAKTLLYEIGYNYPLRAQDALDVSLSGYSTKYDAGGLKYDGLQLRAAYLYRFQ